MPCLCMKYNKQGINFYTLAANDPVFLKEANVLWPLKYFASGNSGLIVRGGASFRFAFIFYVIASFQILGVRF